jgi:hypothetical protein
MVATVAAAVVTGNEIFLSIADQVNTVANKTNQWYLDLGMTCHVTCHHKLLHNYQPSCSTVNLVLGNNFKCHVKGMVQ